MFNLIILAAVTVIAVRLTKKGDYIKYQPWLD